MKLIGDGVPVFKPVHCVLVW